MDLNFNFKEIFSAFMVLFAVIDITGSTPVIIGLKDKGLKVEAGKAALLSSVIFLLFLFLGDAILSLFGVDIQSFAVAGSIIILILACEMVLDIEIFKYQGPGGSATVVPIIFPLIAGAGALTTVLSLRAEYHVETSSANSSASSSLPSPSSCSPPTLPPCSKPPIHTELRCTGICQTAVLIDDRYSFL